MSSLLLRLACRWRHHPESKMVLHVGARVVAVRGCACGKKSVIIGSYKSQHPRLR